MIFSIAIDGPSGSGKSTVAKNIAKELNIIYINTGAMYRAIAYLSNKKGIKSSETMKLIEYISSLDITFIEDDIYVNGENLTSKINTPETTKIVSEYAKIKELRDVLTNMQRKMSKNHSVIMDGRDIGTVVLKDSKFKFYLDATCEERAQRRFKEFKKKSIDISYEEVLHDIKNRDYVDENRIVAPLKKAKDAIIIDTTNKTIVEVTNIIYNYIVKNMEKRNI